MPTLIAVAHGTRSPAGQAQIRDLVARVARRGIDVRLAYVDVQQPRVAEVVPLVPDAVVVPLLLSAGHHVRVDIADAVAGTSIPVTRPLGPDDVLLESLVRHLPRADAVVLAAAGSSDPAWRADVEALAGRLGAAGVGFVSGPGRRVPDIVAGLRAQGARTIAVAAYLLADGLFYRSLRKAGADHVTPPLCLDPAVTDLVVRRFLTTAAARL
ncbi:sirohydrochlorin chelatase [Actinoplanes sp. LDG1-06]|uniref:Sirohydrochlorin chelatase n=1 Tax=Paractinoplanes ovalisporus TaxID=2810368 RepID=A0ABS2A9L7_9ACTN|nr:CbiX/SirB N-terminal domain-containing protein [Actinoplanes ovalisporus]MBM2616511.1 sirohydrochlorin chelatase [Actinoplanes ovalisporus]